MKNLWKVEFDAKYTGVGDLMPESVKVVANGDGLTAVAKARRQVLGSTFWEDGNLRRCRYVKLTGLELLHTIDA